MDPHAMIPLGLALHAYFRDGASAPLIIRRDDGFEVPFPVRQFFRLPRILPP